MFLVIPQSDRAPLENQYYRFPIVFERNVGCRVVDKATVTWFFWFPDPPIKVEWTLRENKCNTPTLFCALPTSRKQVHQTYNKFTMYGNTTTKLQEY